MNTQNTNTSVQNEISSQNVNTEEKSSLSLSLPQDKEYGQRVYVASLSDYNAGILHGKWIDLSGHDLDSLHQEIQEMLSESPAAKRYGDPAEEWAIHDFEGFGEYRLSEYEDLSTILQLVEAAEEHGSELFFAVLSYHGGDLDHVQECLSDRFAGTWESAEAFAENLIEETGALEQMPENLRYYFDYEGYARDLQLGGDITCIELDTEVAIFWSQ